MNPFSKDENFEYTKGQFLFSLYDQLLRAPKGLWIFLILVIILAIPGKYILQEALSTWLISQYDPPHVNTVDLHAKDIEIKRTGFLPVKDNIYSLYSQVVNPNPDLTARIFNYEFSVIGSNGTIIVNLDGSDLLLSGESKFLLQPSVRLDQKPSKVELRIFNTRWTKHQPDLNVRLQVTQQNQGATKEGLFFAEALIKNQETFKVRKVDIKIVVLDPQNQNPVAVNQSAIFDLESLESRYFRLIWPFPPPKHGQITITPSVNLFDPGIKLDTGDVPVR